MNNRIRELAEQAGIEFDDDFPLEPETIYYLKLSDFEKFAELIVRECVAVVDGMADPEDSERYFWAIQNASQKIREHFGVEQ